MPTSTPKAALLSTSAKLESPATAPSTVESVRWDDLQKVEVLTNGDGPLLPDRFWLLHGSGKGGCCIPWGATGDLELLRRLQELPGFDNLALLKPTGSTQEALFVCWQRLTNQS